MAIKLSRPRLWWTEAEDCSQLQPHTNQNLTPREFDGMPPAYCYTLPTASCPERIDTAQSWNEWIWDGS